VLLKGFGGVEHLYGLDFDIPYRRFTSFFVS